MELVQQYASERGTGRAMRLAEVGAPTAPVTRQQPKPSVRRQEEERRRRVRERAISAWLRSLSR
jgi:hypothetical protein